jgi:hypothetical protein
MKFRREKDIFQEINCHHCYNTVLKCCAKIFQNNEIICSRKKCDIVQYTCIFKFFTVLYHISFKNKLFHCFGKFLHNILKLYYSTDDDNVFLEIYMYVYVKIKIQFLYKKIDEHFQQKTHQ